jgi:polyferredoxin
VHAKPKSVLILTAATNGLLLPIITFATIWLRYRLTDRRIAPTYWTDILLWACALIILAVSAVFLWIEVPNQFNAAFGRH